MIHLKNFKLFKEEIDFDVQVTDQPDVKSAKEQLENTKKHLTEYKTKKTAIEEAYLKTSTDADLQKKIEQIIGKKNDNPFISEYLHISSLKRKITKLQTDISNDKIKKDDFNQEVKLITDQKSKQLISSKINDITNRVSTNTATIASLTKDVAESKSKLDKKIIELEKNMMDNIKKLTDESIK